MAAAESSDIGGFRGFGTVLADANELVHGFRPLVALAEVVLADGCADEFGYGCFLAAGAGVEGGPEIVVEVELGTPHDV